MVISEYLTCSEIKGGSFKMTIKEKIEQIENDDNANDEHVLHQLLELAMAVTGRGDVSDDYTHFI